MLRRYLRPSVLVGHVLVLAAALTCLRLGWWQWGVAHATRGTVQNLGYALLWPVFAGAFVYMWLRFLHLESVRESETVREPVGGDGDGAGDLRSGRRNVGDEARERRTAGGASAGAADDSAGHDGGAGGGPEGSRDVPVTGDPTAENAEASETAEPTEPPPDRRRRDRTAHRTPPGSDTVAVAIVGDDDDDDPELAAYNRALAALAEQDERRAR